MPWNSSTWRRGSICEVAFGDRDRQRRSRQRGVHRYKSSCAQRLFLKPWSFGAGYASDPDELARKNSFPLEEESQLGHLPAHSA